MKLDIQETVTQLNVVETNRLTLEVADFGLQQDGISKTLGDAKGDLVGFSAADTPVRIPAAIADGQPLVSDAAEASGVKFGSAGSNEFQLWVHGPAPTGEAGNYRARFSFRINRVTVLGGGGVTGSVTWDIRKNTYANYSATVPASGDSICSATKPGFSGASKSEDSTLSGWTKDVVAGETLRFVIEVLSGCPFTDLIIDCSRT